MGSPTLPPAKAFAHGQRYTPARPPLRRRLQRAVDRMRPAGEEFLSTVIGLLPLILAVGLAFGLVWGAALNSSP